MAPGAAGFASLPGLLEAAIAALAPAGLISVISFDPLIDSAHATWADWNRIGRTIADQHEAYEGFIVTHGTDTMAFTGAALCFALHGLERPVILTGSMVPLGQPGSDARRNLTDAIKAAQTAPAGIWLQFGGQRLHGARLRKTHSSAPNAFAADAPALPPKNPTPRLAALPFVPAEIAILTMAPGASSRAFAAALAACDGAVLRVFGAGTLPDDPALGAALRAAQDRGIPMIAVSQCPEGGIHLGTYAAGGILAETGVIDGAAMTPEAAYAKLAYALGLPAPERADALRGTICGEFG